MPVLAKPRWESFCYSIATGLTVSEAYTSAGYSERGANVSATRLLRNAAIKARIAEICSEIAAIRKQEAVNLVKTEICSRQHRVDALHDRWMRMRQVIDERAADPQMQAAPGGKTGLLTVKYKTQTSMDYGGETGVKISELVPEFEVDTALLRELRAHEEQAARELGQWVEKQDINLKAQVATVSVTLAQVMSPDQLREIEAKMLAQQGGPVIEAKVIGEK